ncbi:hypothetical protein GCM10023313_28930 [Mucilaginibacter defluvii]|uniref:Outer membrane protein beta-barrel domain-containing protein n=2 Tax=Mucilaginibacter defluvii TaxID=1196019 RepID=A0ABP9FZ18_9SPHI
MLLCVASLAAFAQTEKGTQNIGASFAIQNTDSKNTYFNGVGNTTDKNKLNAYSVSANYGYFIADKLDIGVSAGYDFQENRQESDNSDYLQKYKGLFAGVQLRKYILFNDKVGIRTGPSLQYSRDRQTSNFNEESDNVTTTNSYTGRVGLDFVFYSTKHLGVTSNIANVSYSHSKSTGYNTGSANTFSANLVNYLNLGFFYSW